MSSLGEWEFLMVVVAGVASVSFLVGTIFNKATTAHRRIIDRLEQQLADHFEKFGDRLEQALKTAYLNCPEFLRRGGHHERD